MKQPVIRSFEKAFVIDLPVSTVALAVGDFVSWESSALVLMNLVSENASFIGIAMGSCVATTDSGNYIPVMTKGIIECDLTSASYVVGAGLKYTSKNTLCAATDGADQIAWLFDMDGTLTRANILIDVPNLCITGGTSVLFEGPAA